jgi:hypothetical protein
MAYPIKFTSLAGPVISVIAAPIFNFAVAPYDARRRRKRTSMVRF